MDDYGPFECFRLALDKAGIPYSREDLGDGTAVDSVFAARFFEERGFEIYDFRNCKATNFGILKFPAIVVLLKDDNNGHAEYVPGLLRFLWLLSTFGHVGMTIPLGEQCPEVVVPYRDENEHRQVFVHARNIGKWPDGVIEEWEERFVGHVEYEEV